MNDTIRELINSVLDYVARTPGTGFRVKRWARNIIDTDGNQMFFEFWRDDKPHYVSRCIDKQWSHMADLNEGNLRYLLSRLEGEEK